MCFLWPPPRRPSPRDREARSVRWCRRAPRMPAIRQSPQDWCVPVRSVLGGRRRPEQGAVMTRRPDDGLPGTIRPCAGPDCRFQVRLGDGGWAHIDTHGTSPEHAAFPGSVECSKRCGHIATRIDDYGDRYPICLHCFDRLNAARWAAEHGMPVPEADSNLPPCIPMPSACPRCGKQTMAWSTYVDYCLDDDCGYVFGYPSIENARPGTVTDVDLARHPAYVKSDGADARRADESGGQTDG